MMVIMTMMMMTMMMMTMMTMTMMTMAMMMIVSVEQRPGWTDHVFHGFHRLVPCLLFFPMICHNFPLHFLFEPLGYFLIPNIF